MCFLSFKHIAASIYDLYLAIKTVTVMDTTISFGLTWYCESQWILLKICMSIYHNIISTRIIIKAHFKAQTYSCCQSKQMSHFYIHTITPTIMVAYT